MKEPVWSNPKESGTEKGVVKELPSGAQELFAAPVTSATLLICIQTYTPYVEKESRTTPNFHLKLTVAFGD